MCDMEGLGNGSLPPGCCQGNEFDFYKLINNKLINKSKNEKYLPL